MSYPTIDPDTGAARGVVRGLAGAIRNAVAAAASLPGSTFKVIGLGGAMQGPWWGPGSRSKWHQRPPPRQSGTTAAVPRSAAMARLSRRRGTSRRWCPPGTAPIPSPDGKQIWCVEDPGPYETITF